MYSTKFLNVCFSILLRKLYGEDLSDNIPAAKRKKSKNTLKKVSLLFNVCSCDLTYASL